MTEEIKIEIMYKHKDQKKLEKLPGGDWVDLYAAEDVFIPIGEYRNISLGVAMKLPDGYEAFIRPRSSTYKKWGLSMESSGVIDSTYCGSNDIWGFPVVCRDPKHIKNGVPGTEIKFNTKICQFRVLKSQPKINFVTVDSLDYPDRGGFGSTGE